MDALTRIGDNSSFLKINDATLLNPISQFFNEWLMRSQMRRLVDTPAGPALG